jgi:hypothetical protein
MPKLNLAVKSRQVRRTQSCDENLNLHNGINIKTRKFSFPGVGNFFEVITESGISSSQRDEKRRI